MAVQADEVLQVVEAHWSAIDYYKVVCPECSVWGEVHRRDLGNILVCGQCRCRFKARHGR